MNLIRLQHSMDPLDMVSDLLSHSLKESGNSFHLPDIDFQDEGDRFTLKADLPGIRKEDLDISVKGNTLTLKGERKEVSEVKDKKKGWHHSERWYGSFQRTLELPEEVDTSKVSASFKDGVLEITLPKSENAKPKQIRVEVK
jgi:HSP20 family protein